MSWVSDVLKHLGVSKVFVVAIFSASAILVLGPRVWPNDIPDAGVQWKVVAIASLVFSGVYVVAWISQAIWWGWIQFKNGVLVGYRSKTLTNEEIVVLCEVAKHPHETLNLRTLNFDGHTDAKLKLMREAKRLQRKGLVRIVDGDSIIYLTERGKDRTLLLLEQARRSP
jgi:hypothetical protein